MFRGLSAVLAALFLVVAAPAGAVDVSAYGRLPAIDQVSLSPNGARLAYVTTLGEQRRLVVMELPEKVLLNVSVGDARVRDVSWAGDDHLLVSVSNTQSATFDYSQNELWQVISVNVVTQKTVPIFERDAMVYHAVFGEYGVAQIDGHWFGYFGGVTLEQSRGFKPTLGHGYTDLYRVDLDTGADLILARGNDLTVGWIVDRNGKPVVQTEYQQVSGTWSIYAKAQSDAPVITKPDPLGDVRLVGQGRTPGTVIVFDRHLEELTLADGSHRALPVDNGETVDAVLQDPITDLAIGVIHERTHEVRFFDPARDARFKAVAKAFGRRTWLISYSADFKRLVVETEGKSDSGTYWLIDGAQANIIDNPYPDVAAAKVGESQMISFKASDGLAMEGVLTLPQERASKDLPVIVLPHGGPVDYDSLGFDWWAQAFVSQGYAVFQPNFRGSSGYGRDFRDAGFGQWGRKMQTDISDGLAEIARKGIVDPKRACIVGWSYGGYAALAGVTVQTGLYRCAVSMAGISDLNELLAKEHRDDDGEPSAGMRFERRFMGANSDADSSLHEISPARLAARADAPILLIHGIDDTTVPIEQSRIMERALRGAGKPVEFLEIKGEEHQMLREAGRKAMLDAAVNFVIKHNPPDPAPAVATAATAPGSSR